MPNIIKKWVSKNKRRYQQEGFNLDLAYISDRLIAMGFPADSLEGVYRNHVDDVQRFLEQKHENHYKVYNLCQEREYNPSKFKGPVMRFPFEDHNPPPFEMMNAFCEDVKKWLDGHKENVAVIHCKAGKGRTGLMICAYLIYEYGYNTDSALSYYANERTKDSKGVTIPSQRRYVHYFESHLNQHLTYKPISLRLVAIKLSSVPHISASSYCNFIISVRHLHLPNKKIISEVFGPAKRGETDVLLFSEFFQPKLCRDFRIDVYNKSLFANRVNLFHFWLNASFVHKMAFESQISALHELKTQHQFHLNNFNNESLDKENNFNEKYSNDIENGLDVIDKSNNKDHAVKSQQDCIQFDEHVNSSTKDNDKFDAADYYENCIFSNIDDRNMSDNKKIKIINNASDKNVALADYGNGLTHSESMYSSFTPDNAIHHNEYDEDIKKKCQKYDGNKNKSSKSINNHDINSNKNIGINHTTNLKIMNALKKELVSKANARSMNTLQNTLNDEGSRQVLISYKKMEESSSSSVSKVESPPVGRDSSDVFVFKNTDKTGEIQDSQNHKEKIDTSNQFISTSTPNNAPQKDIYFKRTKSPSVDLRSKTFLTLILKKSDLDKAVKDKQNKIFPKDFEVTLYLSECNSIENNNTSNTISHYDFEESDDDDEFVRYSV